jgi:hypothetical protein
MRSIKFACIAAISMIGVEKKPTDPAHRTELHPNSRAAMHE